MDRNEISIYTETGNMWTCLCSKLPRSPNLRDNMYCLELCGPKQSLTQLR